MREKQFLSGFGPLAGFGIDVHDLQADYTRERIKEYFVTHPGASSKDACRDLGLSRRTLTTYLPQIKREWRIKEK